MRLLAPAVAVPVAETAILLAFGRGDAAAVGPQVTAPPPFDLFHDLRWISVYHASWWSLAVELLAVLALRSAYVAWMVQAAWPAGDPPPMPRAAVRVAVFYATAAVLLLPWVTLLFGMAIVHLSYLFFVAVPATLLVALVIHRGALTQAAGWWWRWHPSWSSLAWTLGAFVWLTLSGAVIARGPWPLALLAAAGAGGLNALAVARITRRIALGPGRPSYRRALLVPVALCVTFAIVVGGTAVGFAMKGSAAPPDPTPQRIPASASGHPVLLVSGFNSRWSPRPPISLPPGFVGWRYSYAGLGPGGEFLPYGPSDTLQPVVLSARRMADEVDALSRAYHHPVSIVAESEGALIARIYLLSEYRPASREVDRAVILDMPVGVSSAYFPPAGSEGWGVGSGWTLRGLTTVVRHLGPLELTTDAPLFRDIATCSSLMRIARSAPPPPGVEEITVEALGDAVDDGATHSIPADRSYLVAATHGGLMSNPAVQAVIDGALAGRPVRGSSIGWWVADTIAALSSPWRTPGLAPSVTVTAACEPVRTDGS